MTGQRPMLWKITRHLLTAALCTGIVASSAWAQPNASLDPGDSTYKLFAVSPTANSLTDRGNATNREWTNATSESLTELLTISATEGYGLIRSKAVSIDIKVPLGWHAIEDFERLAIFNPERSVRVIVWRVDLDFEGVPDLERYVAGKASLFHSRFPAMQASSRTLSDGQVMGVMSNIPPRKGDKEPRTIVDLLTPNPENSKRALLMTFGMPMSRATEFLPLLALMARDRDIKWRKDY